jgi:hypothetical protein
MTREQEIFSLGFSCGQVIEQERMTGLYDDEINKHILALDWEAEKMFEVYDKVKILFPEVCKTLNV